MVVNSCVFFMVSDSSATIYIGSPLTAFCLPNPARFVIVWRCKITIKNNVFQYFPPIIFLKDVNEFKAALCLPTDLLYNNEKIVKYINQESISTENTLLFTPNQPSDFTRRKLNVYSE